MILILKSKSCPSLLLPDIRAYHTRSFGDFENQNQYKTVILKIKIITNYEYNFQNLL